MAVVLVAGALVAVGTGVPASAAVGAGPRATGPTPSPSAVVPVRKKKCGYVKVNGRPTYKYCGPARITVWVGAQEYQVRKGKCFFDKKNNGYFTANIGMNQVGAAAPTASYARVVISSAAPEDDIAYSGSLTLVVPGTRFAITGFAGTVTAGATAGTVEAQTTDGVPVRASFTCT